MVERESVANKMVAYYLTENLSTPSTDQRMLCTMALEISRQTPLLIATIATIVVCCCGLFASLMLAYLLHRRSVYHVNVRLLLWNMCVALCVLSVGVAYLSVDHLTTFLRHQGTPCRMLISGRQCLTQRSVALILPTYVVAYAPVALTLERAYATWQYRSYEARPSPAIGWTLILVQWLAGGAVPVLMTQMSAEGHALQLATQMPYCISLLITPNTTTASLLILFGCQSISLVTILTLLVVNARKQRLRTGRDSDVDEDGGGRLRARYQLSENVRTTRLLAGCVTGHILCSAGVLPTALHITQTGDLLEPHTIQQLAIVNELLSTCIALYAPIFCLCCILQLRSAAGCLPLCVCGSQLPEPATVTRRRPGAVSSAVVLSVMRASVSDASAVATSVSAEQHFRQLDVLWSDVLPPRRLSNRPPQGTIHWFLGEKD